MVSYFERLYYKDIGRFPVINEKRELELVELIQAGHKEYINELILGNLRFVVSIARKYQNRGLSLLELINEGNLGLYKASKRFNTKKEVKFTSYAVWWVRQCIQKALFDQAGIVKIPPNKLALVSKFRRLLDANSGDWYKTLDHPDIRDVREEVVEVLEKMSPVSLDAPLNTDDDDDGVNTLLDVIGRPPEQEDDIERKELKAVFDAILADMSKREEAILRMYYGIDFDREFTLEEIGQKLKLTRERVRQVKNKALRKLYKNKELQNQLKKNLDLLSR
ncbi:MAG: RNA polymerase subunit sigma-32 [Candidatus Raymondbacteria bacterium RifOxyA12_full_50_37]|uniref:RNA polymerase subunit sigma-32 n=1 Tax=Candidatus Raymondbacteria bacterium RIFOXYD12_FULL_49_13 TaxID=1817890 RepID=A0A1F7FFT2_UNCRA|nr:MAG: RNA polymerase subunit sigma-32 [Candidatus Raymondbacteria bacterium RifOxyA12_full_50_37]OGJ93562.1 MAG: RNA polymerase subunit sigma-32 [Candidatus Raymondbacteria bacterium RifOxyB12_full_50_8]OGJ94242.1 MAG: RNA polymerase subunit sigma-32 [Candidatus Raymondbacteria bacterium RIFOXYA2_FULL_49_16]OGJ99072.1 MAG: RNA polymerase subunit sigma-32 [Candidatus Raymondbacteria bacterium RIFOXYC2_FULL_50_21]OGK05451.1 MAG: RNA polymerase subunit sigma-32 [Candidatus Raymondbacteria bacter